MKGKRKKYELRRNVNVPWEIMESEAFRELSATGMFVLLRFLQKRSWSKVKKKGGVIYNDHDLVFTYAEAEALGISTSQFNAVITKLHDVGLIDIEHQGGGVGRDYSRYAISTRWRHYGTPLFEKVEKQRRLWPGQDVRSRMERMGKTTGFRHPKLREIVAIDKLEHAQGAGSS